ncbi:hypothetical protein [Streptomyces candidus]|uniref:Uncharacterized protein n=1 Tax=Streptomyces candidus TaxID=67283 RepID=A0A7X0LSS5_9ACTN|nr:hypothetical protein [Streptomyces candidus]MBB6438256.1 hypothetical protein [Streptomyces candidus]
MQERRNAQETRMFEYEIHQNRSAELIEQAARARLARQALRKENKNHKSRTQQGSSFRSHFTRAA